jgi:hypothetical protein
LGYNNYKNLFNKSNEGQLNSSNVFNPEEGFLKRSKATLEEGSFKNQILNTKTNLNYNNATYVDNLESVFNKGSW